MVKKSALTSLKFRCFCRLSHAIHLYVFDRAHYSGTWHFDLPKTGIHRAQFIRDSVVDLRDSLSKAGSNLIVRHGSVLDAIRHLLDQCSSSAFPIQTLVFQREVTKEETDLEAEISRLAKDKQIQVSLDLFSPTFFPSYSYVILPD